MDFSAERPQTVRRIRPPVVQIEDIAPAKEGEGNCMSAHILTDLTDRILTVRIDRPTKKNALTVGMYDALTAALTAATDDQEIRVFLLTGTSDCFTAGNDLGDFLEQPPTSQDSPAMRFLEALRMFPKPLVAAVNGVAIGIGTTLLLHCDLVYAGESAQFRLPFVDLGIVPEAASSLLLPQHLGQRAAAELLMLAEPFAAGVAQACGLVNQVLADAEVEPYARRQAVKLAAKPPTALRLTKQLMKRATAQAMAEAMAAEGDCVIRQLQGPEASEALNAFRQKRPPDFSRF